MWLLGGLAVVALIAILAWVVGVNPRLQQASAADSQKIAAQSQLQQTEAQLAQLKKDYASIDQLKAQLAALQQSVPGTKDLTTFMRQLAQQSAAAQVSMGSISISDPTAYTPTAAGAAAPASPTQSTPAPTASTAASTASSPPSSTAPRSATPTPTPNATAAPSAPPLPTDPQITSANFVILPVSLTVDGSYRGVMAFTSALQNIGPRLFLVNKIEVKQDSSSGDASLAGASNTATLSGFIYVLLGNG